MQIQEGLNDTFISPSEYIYICYQVMACWNFVTAVHTQRRRQWLNIWSDSLLSERSQTGWVNQWIWERPWTAAQSGSPTDEQQCQHRQHTRKHSDCSSTAPVSYNTNSKTNIAVLKKSPNFTRCGVLLELYISTIRYINGFTGKKPSKSNLTSRTSPWSCQWANQKKDAWHSENPNPARLDGSVSRQSVHTELHSINIEPRAAL